MSELSTSEFESIVNAVAAEQSGIVSVTNERLSRRSDGAAPQPKGILAGGL